MNQDNLTRINEYYEYELDIKLEKAEGKVYDNIAVVELRLYETLPESKTRRLINTYSKKVKKPSIIQFLLGFSWSDKIEITEETLKTRAIHQACHRWTGTILPEEIRNLIK